MTVAGRQNYKLQNPVGGIVPKSSGRPDLGTFKTGLKPHVSECKWNIRSHLKLIEYCYLRLRPFKRIGNAFDLIVSKTHV